MDTLTDILSYPFMVNAIIAGTLAAFACGIVGTLIVCNRLVFLAGGASHAAYGGIGLALFLGLPVLPCTILFSLAASLLMAFVSLKQEKRSSVSTEPDAAIGVLWAAGMAFGIILIELTPGYAGELMGFLFGSVLSVPQEDLLVLLGFDVLLMLVLFFFWQGLWAISIDKSFAAARGISTTALYLLLVALTAVAAVLLIRIVGLILVLALLTIPPQIARQYCRSLHGTMIMACLLAFCFCMSGLLLSWFTNISSGPSIITVATLSYFFVMILPGQRKQ